MRIHKFAALVAMLSYVLPTMASSQRTFVSGFGSDSNPCTHDQPCRSFAVAIAATNANGEVVAVDSAGYGPVTITQGVTIVAPLGVHAGISVPAAAGVTVNAGTNGVVVLRNLFINSQGGSTGIDDVSAAELYIQHCVVRGFSSNGINIHPAGSAFASIADTEVRDSGQSGIYANGTALSISIDSCRVEKNQYGLAVDQALAAVRSSAFNENLQNGVFARGSGGGADVTITDSSIVLNVFTAVELDSGNLSLVNCTMTGNSTGVDIAGGTARMTRCTITRNFLGIAVAAAATLNSVGDSLVNGNTTDKSGTITPIPAM